jgi:hypothetical protein
MGWRAETMHGQIGPNTVLSIFEEPWGPGLPVRPLPSGVSLAIRFPNGAAASLDVIEASATEAIIQTSNQAKWRMVQVAPKELRFPAADTADAPTTYWVVKDQVK